jgi:thiol:disulfide interchange protein
MKLIKRTTLLGLTIALAALLLTYTFLRTFTSIKLDQAGERIAMICLICCALGIFIMNRRLAAEEKKENEAQEAAENAKTAETDESPETSEPEKLLGP